MVAKVSISDEKPGTGLYKSSRSSKSSGCSGVYQMERYELLIGGQKEAASRGKTGSTYQDNNLSDARG
ncbi:MAG TPA: hypothetical protein VFK47_00970 [Ktedonobacteraceae bacterium]|nr:hypothetical protein [Ktedonobacteraceae bacterium]